MQLISPAVLELSSEFSSSFKKILQGQALVYFTATTTITTTMKYCIH